MSGKNSSIDQIWCRVLGRTHPAWPARATDFDQNTLWFSSKIGFWSLWRALSVLGHLHRFRDHDRDTSDLSGRDDDRYWAPHPNSSDEEQSAARKKSPLASPRQFFSFLQNVSNSKTSILLMNNRPNSKSMKSRNSWNSESQTFPKHLRIYL